MHGVELILRLVHDREPLYQVGTNLRRRREAWIRLHPATGELLETMVCSGYHLPSGCLRPLSVILLSLTRYMASDHRFDGVVQDDGAKSLDRTVLVSRSPDGVMGGPIASSGGFTQGLIVATHTYDLSRTCYVQWRDNGFNRSSTSTTEG